MYTPKIREIQNAIKYHELIQDSFLKNFAVALKNDGKPREWGGGFGMVYKMERDNEKWALKVWHREIPNNKERYQKVSAHLAHCNLPYFLRFEYLVGGLIVIDQARSEKRVDCVRIEWVDGWTLRQYISNNINNREILGKVARDFLKMIKDLHRCEISHGDLQNENIIVTKDGCLKLIDYDALCVPQLDDQIDFCRGFRGYQHPTRFAAAPLVASVKIDHFSQLIVYISICAIMEYPLLWVKHHCERDERLLFNDRDFMEWENSEIRRDLNLLSEEIREYVKLLDRYLASHIYLPAFFHHVPKNKRRWYQKLWHKTVHFYDTHLS